MGQKNQRGGKVFMTRHEKFVEELREGYGKKVSMEKVIKNAIDKFEKKALRADLEAKFDDLFEDDDDC